MAHERMQTRRRAQYCSDATTEWAVARCVHYTRHTSDKYKCKGTTGRRAAPHYRFALCTTPTQCYWVGQRTRLKVTRDRSEVGGHFDDTITTFKANAKQTDQTTDKHKSSVPNVRHDKTRIATLAIWSACDAEKSGGHDGAQYYGTTNGRVWRTRSYSIADDDKRTDIMVWIIIHHRDTHVYNTTTGGGGSTVGKWLLRASRCLMDANTIMYNTTRHRLPDRPCSTTRCVSSDAVQ